METMETSLKKREEILSMHQDSTPSLDELVLNRCQALLPVSVVTTVAPVEEQQFLYIAAADRLYSVNASDGTVRWCQQVMLTLPSANTPKVIVNVVQ
jgi:hypothetical protein